MNIHEEIVGSAVVVIVDGHIDAASAPAVDTALALRVEEPQHRILIDLTLVEYVSSAGFRAVLQAARKSDAVGGRLVLCGVSQKVRQLFALGGLADLLTITATREEAWPQ
jgi:stage II sporulation protein AA (anti-sigma F factor antagonist)